MYLRNRETMGNMCLIAFLAFLCVQIAFFAGEGKVYAQPTVTVEGDGTLIVDGQRITLPTIILEPLTEPYISTAHVTLHLYDRGTARYTVLDRIYNLVVSVYEQVYRGVLSAVYYVVPQGITVPTLLDQVYPVRIDEIVYRSVYLSVYLRPPELPPPPPLEPGEPPPLVIVHDGLVTIGVPTGMATIDAQTGTATARPFFDKFLQSVLDPSTQEVLVGNLSSIDTREHRFETTLGLMSMVATRAVKFEGNVNLTLTGGAIDFGALNQQYPGAALVYSAATITGEEAEELLTEISGQPWQAASPVYEVRVYVARGATVLQVIPTFTAEAVYGFPYNPNADPDAVAAHQLLDDGSLLFIPSQVVDLLSGQVLVTKPGTSRYVVLENTKEFTDVPKDHWAHREVKQMVTRYVIKGMTETTFEPATTVTRAQFVTMLQRALSVPEHTPDTPTFTDVKPGDWFFAPVEAAVKAGLAAGMGDGSFAPNAPVTREQMATFIARAMTIAGKPTAVSAAEAGALLQGFVDQGQISDWAVQNAAIAVKTGIIRGLPGNVYAPADDGNRAQAATMIKRFLAYLGLVAN